MIGVAVLASSFGNLLLAMGMEHMPSFGHSALIHYLFRLVDNPFVIPGTILSAIYTFTQISLFSWADLSFVIPCMASSYALTTLLSEFVLGEQIQWGRWAGVLLITCGVFLVAETPVNTKTDSTESPA